MQTSCEMCQKILASVDLGHMQRLSKHSLRPDSIRRPGNGIASVAGAAHEGVARWGRMKLTTT